MKRKELYVIGKDRPIKNNLRELLHNKSFWIAVIVAAIVVGTFLFWWSKNKTNDTHNTALNQCNNQPTSNIYNQAELAILNPTKQYSALRIIVDKITADPNYQNDPNCLYPIVMYYSYMSDTSSADKYYNLLNKVYNAKQGFAKVYDVKNGIKTVKYYVDSTRKLDQQQKKNTIYGF